MSGRLTRFLGDSPLRVAIRLLILSFAVGFALDWLNLHPLQIYAWAEELAAYVWRMGFTLFDDVLGYFILGALIVVPLFLLSRVLRLGRRGPGAGGRP